jgi:hypothetical protein
MEKNENVSFKKSAKLYYSVMFNLGALGVLKHLEFLIGCLSFGKS